MNNAADQDCQIGRSVNDRKVSVLLGPLSNYQHQTSMGRQCGLFYNGRCSLRVKIVSTDNLIMSFCAMTVDLPSTEEEECT